jgi:hypothetical protein
MGTIQPKLIRISEIIDIQGFKLICLWSNGEVRVNDFDPIVRQWDTGRNQFLAQLSEPGIFHTAFAKSGTVAFAGALVDIGDMGLQPLDLDPDVLFETSQLIGESVSESVS